MTSGDGTVHPTVGDGAAEERSVGSKKPVSADRRIQNRKAQKAYRDRKRERLKQLEETVAFLENNHPTHLQGLQSSSSTSSVSTGRTVASSAVSLSRFPDLSPQHSPEAPADGLYSSDSGLYSNDTDMWLDMTLPEMALSSLNAGQDQILMAEENREAQNLILSDSTGAENLNNIQQDAGLSTIGQLRSGVDGQSPLHLQAVSTNAHSKSTNPMLIHIYRPSSKALSISPQLVRECFMSVPQTTRDSLRQLSQKGDFRFVDLVLSMLEGANNPDTRELEPLSPVVQSIVEPLAYSPYRNVLRIARFSYFAALFTNFSSLGFDFSLFLDETCISPFCRRSDLNSDDAHIPPGLRPVPSQLTTDHHPYIDALPFPSFRSRALAALSTDPPLLDEDDLCIDLMLNDGLVCWGSAGQGGMDRGTPWDSHSWEAKEWFLQKWWWLVGGQESELWWSSQWWKSQRGEKISLWKPKGGSQAV